ncbi:hypothetical protein RJ640_006451 [Escallonia rubra]|uniref:non-specific serine/threonine protein kinase n=1 Tax=Escallonia rubra TaxID=112253 RepID=A0AA88RD44_9ASTE|nr:hypothetical protein RJ640_006451 [Escallonia rubra]
MKCICNEIVNLFPQLHSAWHLVLPAKAPDMMMFRLRSPSLYLSYILFCSSLFKSTSGFTNETDKQALLAIKNQILEDPFEVLSSWNDSIHFCYWQGVSCSPRHQRVTVLDLPSLKLLGSVSPYIGNLTFLNTINMVNNSLHGTIPEDIGKLYRLQHLSLYLNSFQEDNYISGSMPLDIGNLVNLEFLGLSNNMFSGNVPESIGNLFKLTEVYLYGNYITGKLPSSIGNISELSVLALEANMIEGRIPLSMGNCTKLQALDLQYNQLIGMIPEQLVGLSSLSRVLCLNQNRLTGPLPSQVGNLKNLGLLNISGNRLTGAITSALGDCQVLEFLDMHDNLFEGTIPLSLKQLKGIKVLDLSRNMLSGQIPKFLSELPLVEFLNLSYNELEGEVPTEGVFKNVSAFSIVGNMKLCGGNQALQLPACPGKVTAYKKRHHFPRTILPLVTSLPLILLLACVLGIIYRLVKVKQQTNPTSLWQDEYPKLSYAELHKATDGFASTNLIGEGSYGIVYKGILAANGQIVAVKVLNLEQHRAHRSFWNECEILKNIRHRNLIKIITSCSSIDRSGKDFKALIFEYMPNGSLDSWLHSTSLEQMRRKSLNLLQRIGIAIDVASVLEYLHLHCETPITHCDLKPSNILLDDKLCAHVSDFGLARFHLAPTTTSNDSEMSSATIRGTVGYIPPEYGNGATPSRQGDMYSYGILLLEMFTGKAPTDAMFTANFSLHSYVKEVLHGQVMQIVDPHIIEEEKDGSTNNQENMNGNVFRMEHVVGSSNGAMTKLWQLVFQSWLTRLSLCLGSCLTSKGTRQYMMVFRLRSPSLYLSCILFCASLLTSTSGLTNETDKQALLAIKNQILEDPFQVLSSWNDSIHFCNWQGVSCSHRHQRVTTLNLPSLKLTGSVSPHIGNLTFLNAMNMGNNSLHGTIPQEIGKLYRLQHLSLSLNSFQDVGNLVNLEYLSLSNNMFSGNVPESIGNLFKLTEVYLYRNYISGKLPSSIGNISELSVLALEANMIEGRIPLSLGNCTKLQALDLQDNQLIGMIPEQLVGLSSLSRILCLKNNRLTGPLPLQVGILKNLGFLSISRNRLKGAIPSAIGDCQVLEFLNIRDNLFEGTIPSSLKQLKGIRVLDLSRNMLSGQIPKFLSELPLVEFLNLSYNELEGEVPTEGVFKNVSAFSIVGNMKLCGGNQALQLPACPGKVTADKKRRHFPRIILALLTSLPLILLLACVLGIIYRLVKVKQQTNPASLWQDKYPKLSYAELHKATDGFASTNLIGEGSYGIVYKGILAANGQIVAVKVLNLEQHRAHRSFWNECEIVKNIRHRNLIKIITSCSSIDRSGKDFKALIFEYMPNGSLDIWLHSTSLEQMRRKSLNLLQRIGIAIDVASVLEYLHLHCETPITHCDLKPSNILLDDKLCAHVSDFGLARFHLAPTTASNDSEMSSATIRGTVGYIRPEYGNGATPSRQGDMYSYGILLLEMFTGKAPTDAMFTANFSLHSYVKEVLPGQVMEIVDPHIIEEEKEGSTNTQENMNGNVFRMEVCMASVFQLGLQCSAESPRERMDVKDVTLELRKIRNEYLGAADRKS